MVCIMVALLTMFSLEHFITAAENPRAHSLQSYLRHISEGRRGGGCVGARLRAAGWGLVGACSVRCVAPHLDGATMLGKRVSNFRTH